MKKAEGAAAGALFCWLCKTVKLSLTLFSKGPQKFVGSLPVSVFCGV